ncbi:YraN family protein [Patescibacteria group bacterium]|nr:YraN family protein [Patescibacteria group bacterium]
MIYIEVRTRTNSLYIYNGAAQAISYHKLRKLIRTSDFYKFLRIEFSDSLRIDAGLIDVNSSKNVKKIQHVENT